MRLKDKVAIITGGGSGLGRECGFLFTAEGAKVVLVDRVAERVKAAAAEIAASGGEVVPVVADVGMEEEIAGAVQTAVDSFGTLDIMFANAGHQTTLLGRTPLEEITPDEWADIVSTNLSGVIWSTKHAVRVMKAHDVQGSIVLTGSAAAVRAFPTSTLYSATKGGVNGFCIAVAREVGPLGIRVNVLNPLQGMSPNFMMARDAPVVGKSYEEAAGDAWDGSAGAAPLNLRRPPTLTDNARSVLFLASDDSGHMTGQALFPNDGGILTNIAMNFSDDWVDRLIPGQ